MQYKPHKIEKWQQNPPQRNSNGDIVNGSDGEWVELGSCRCDDVDNQTLQGIDGKAYNPLYKIICEKDIEITKGDKVRAMYNDTERGKGTVEKVIKNNYLNYQTIWLT